MKILGGIIFLAGVMLFITVMLTKYGSEDWALLGCVLMPGGILLGYLGSRPYHKQ